MTSWEIVLLAAAVGGVVAAIVNGVFVIVSGKMQTSAQTSIVKLNHAHDIALKRLEDSWRVRDRKYERLRRHSRVVMRVVIQLADEAEALNRTPADKIHTLSRSQPIRRLSPMSGRTSR